MLLMFWLLQPEPMLVKLQKDTDQGMGGYVRIGFLRLRLTKVDSGKIQTVIRNRQIIYCLLLLITASW